MRLITLRARVTVAAAAAIVLAVVGLGVLVIARLDGQLARTMDRSLRARAVDVARLSASTPKLLTAPGALEEVWGEGEAGANVVDRYVAYLRRKLGDPPLIHTVRGVGFVIGR